MAQKNKITSLLFFFLKLGIAAGAVWYLLLRNPQEIAACFSHLNICYISGAALLYFLHMVFSAWRWRRLAGMLQVRLSPFEALSLTLQGYFFSLVIPGGAIGGDVVKMGVISKRSPSGEKFEGVFSILMDRIIGMIALFSMALLLIPCTASVLLAVKLPGTETTPLIRQLVLAGLVLLCLSGLAASCVIFFHRTIRKVPLFDKLMQWGDKLSHGLVTRMTSATDVYSGNRKELFFLVVFSIFAIHLLTALPVCLLLTGLGVSGSFLTVITALTIGNIVGLIPLFPAGVGGRDAAAILIMSAGGILSSDAQTVQLIYTAILLVVSLACGLFFIFDKGRKNPLLVQENK
ncbi:MAG: flippase-like domain-containing protein [Lentisphaeria bacterium]|nr:flippase-like domain-containing protein [Lentisphaeria bacterium]